MVELHYKRQKNGTIFLPGNVVSLLDSHRQLRIGSTEAGGILLGRLLNNSDDAIIDRITEPGPGDERRRFSFKRGLRRSQESVNAVWHETSGSVNYLGEWHTHPEEIPTPSRVDIDDWVRIIKHARFESGFLIFIIVGTHAIKIWEFCVGATTPTELPLILRKE